MGLYPPLSGPGNRALFFTCVGLVDSPCSGVDSCGCRLTVTVALQGKKMTAPKQLSDPEPPDGAASPS